MSPSFGSCLIFTPAVVVVGVGIAGEGAPPAPGAGPALSPGDPRPPPAGAPAPFTRGPGLLLPLPPPLQSASSVLPLSMRLTLQCSESGGRSRSGGGEGDIRCIFSCSTVSSISVLPVQYVRGQALCVSHCVVRTVCCVREESCSLYERHISTAPLHTASCYLIPLHYISSRRAMPTVF